MCEEYNGWTNRETWALALWLDNDEGLRALTEDMISDAIFAANEGGEVHQVAQALQEMTEELLTASGYEFSHGSEITRELIEVAEDIGSLYRVDYAEIARGYVADFESNNSEVTL